MRATPDRADARLELRAVLRREARRGGLEVLERVDLAAWTSLRVGGPADLLIRCTTEDGAMRAVRALRDAGATWFVLGAGSNLLVPDEGLRVPVLTLAGELAGWELEIDGVVAGGGANLTQVARAAVRSGLDGLVELFGVPGTVGGAVAMNAGAYGVELFDLLDWVEVVTPAGEAVRRAAEEIAHGYRWSAIGEGELVVRARLRLEPGNLGEMNRRLSEIGRLRRTKLPAARSAGSVFRNPEGEAAGRLLEAAGCKGLRVGGARVSERHANVVVTDRGATAADVLALIREMARRVRERFGVELRPELRIVDPWGRRVTP